MNKKDYNKTSFSKTGKRVLVSTLALSLAMSGTVWASLNNSVFKKDITLNTKESYAIGDVDKNGSVELEDANIALKAALKITTLSDEDVKLADTDFNGLVELEDANTILKIALRINTPIPQPTTAASETPSESVSDKPSETVVPTTTASSAPVTATPTATPTATSVPTTKPSPTPVVSHEPTPVPTVMPHKTLTAEAAEVVTGNAVAVDSLNGAKDEDGILTFTADNKAAKAGIKMVNPFAGKTELRETIDQALSGQPLLTELAGHTAESTYDPNLKYPRPVWSNGVSISFWVKSDWTYPERTNTAPILVFKNDKNNDTSANTNASTVFAAMIRLNGSVRFEGCQTGNEFRANNYVAGNNNEWNYYTITFANDMITVYVNGEEVVYDTTFFKSANCELFNDGFMTRYNTVGTVTQTDVDKDIRGYILSSGGWYKSGDKMISHAEYTIIGNARYANPGAVSGYQLLVDLLSNDATQMYIGGVDSVKVNSNNTGTAAYSVPEGSKVTQITSYNSELKAGEVTANYLASYAENKTKLGLK